MSDLRLGGCPILITKKKKGGTGHKMNRKRTKISRTLVRLLWRAADPGLILLDCVEWCLVQKRSQRPCTCRAPTAMTTQPCDRSCTKHHSTQSKRITRNSSESAPMKIRAFNYLFVIDCGIPSLEYDGIRVMSTGISRVF